MGPAFRGQVSATTAGPGQASSPSLRVRCRPCMGVGAVASLLVSPTRVFVAPGHHTDPPTSWTWQAWCSQGTVMWGHLPMQWPGTGGEGVRPLGESRAGAQLWEGGPGRVAGARPSLLEAWASGRGRALLPAGGSRRGPRSPQARREHREVSRWPGSESFSEPKSSGRAPCAQGTAPLPLCTPRRHSRPPSQWRGGGAGPPESGRGSKGSQAPLAGPPLRLL